MQDAVKGFWRLKAYRQLPLLRTALAAHQSKHEDDTTLEPDALAALPCNLATLAHLFQQRVGHPHGLVGLGSDRRGRGRDQCICLALVGERGTGLRSFDTAARPDSIPSFERRGSVHHCPGRLKGDAAYDGQCVGHSSVGHSSRGSQPPKLLGRAACCHIRLCRSHREHSVHRGCRAASGPSAA